MKAERIDPKRSWDTIIVAVDWSRHLKGGRTMTSLAWVSSPPGLDVAELPMEGSDARLRVGGGDGSGSEYEILCRMGFSDGQRREKPVLLRVED